MNTNTRLLVGGSGRWVLESGGRLLAAGHLPRRSPYRVIGQQADRQARGEPVPETYLGGGQIIGLEKAEISESLIERLSARYDARHPMKETKP